MKLVGFELKKRPVKPAIQEHWNEFLPSIHIAPFWQGLLWHSLTFISHLTPEKPLEHSQMKLKNQNLVKINNLKKKNI